MGLLAKLFGLSIIASPFVFYLFINDQLLPKPDPTAFIPEKKWFGPGKDPVDTLPTTSKPFKINVSEKQIENIKKQLDLDRNRLAKSIQNTGFTYGFNSDYLKHMVSYWIEEFDWKKVSRMFCCVNCQLTTVIFAGGISG